MSGPYDPAMPCKDPAVENATRVFRRILERRYPGVVLMRLTPRELERLGCVPASRPRDLNLGVVEPHDVDAAA